MERPFSDQWLFILSLFQGYTRPKVLIMLPTRNLAFKLVRRLVALAMRETRGDTVQGKEKFVEQFTNPEVSVDINVDQNVHAECHVHPSRRTSDDHLTSDDGCSLLFMDETSASHDLSFISMPRGSGGRRG